MSEIERNIVNKARRIVLEGLINLRRNWEVMSRHQDNTVSAGGQAYLANYKHMMIGISSADYLDNDAEGIINFDDTENAIDIGILSSLSRYMLLELTKKELDDLAVNMANSIALWSNSSKDLADRDMSKETIESIEDALMGQPQYMVLILLTDLHQYTFVESVAKCLETF